MASSVNQAVVNATPSSLTAPTLWQNAGQGEAVVFTPSRAMAYVFFDGDNDRRRYRQHRYLPASGKRTQRKAPSNAALNLADAVAAPQMNLAKAHETS
ncbi:MAG: hypothetical protein ACLUI3_08440 [Christensenellales bacterium]